MSRIALFLLLSFLPAAFSASFPLTAVSHYSSLAPCAVSHLTQELDSWPYDGCSSNTPISAYGSCICAQRLGSIQKEISIDFEFDPECSTTGVQPFLTAFCNKWGVDIGAVDGIGAGTTTASGDQSGPTTEATPGSVGTAGQPVPTSTSSSPGASPSGSIDGGSDNRVTIIASVVGSVAGVIAVVIAWLTYRHMREGSHGHSDVTTGPAGHGHPNEMHGLPSPPREWPPQHPQNAYSAPYHYPHQVGGRGGY